MTTSTEAIGRLRESEWQARRAAHEARLRTIVGPHIERQGRHVAHPILDFLFQYYPFRSAWLMRWGPGPGVVLEGDSARAFLRFEHYVECDGGVVLAPPHFSPARRAGLEWILNLLEATAERPPRFGCFGLHEWAMVYRAPERRHAHVPLRMSNADLARFVESQRIVCSHFDAFRFFTPAARPLNSLQPTRESIPELEQRGCLHANMDLYKWATKIWPWIDSELLADAFLLAVEIRDLDMRASPYDLSAYGYAPVPIETEEGRREYQQRQAFLAEKAQPIRARLIEHYRLVLSGFLHRS